MARCSGFNLVCIHFSELGACRSPACSFYLAANFPDLTSKARNRSLRPEGVSLFERHPPHFSTGVYRFQNQRNACLPGEQQDETLGSDASLPERNVSQAWLDTIHRPLPSVQYKLEKIDEACAAPLSAGWLATPVANSIPPARVSGATLVSKFIPQLPTLLRGFRLYSTDTQAPTVRAPRSPVTPLARLRGLSTSRPGATAVSVDCGCPASSLRERIEALPAEGTLLDRYGIVIFTDSSDAREHWRSRRVSRSSGKSRRDICPVLTGWPRKRLHFECLQQVGHHHRLPDGTQP